MVIIYLALLSVFGNYSDPNFGNPSKQPCYGSCKETEHQVHQILKDLPKNQDGLYQKCILISFLANECLNTTKCTFESSLNIGLPALRFQEELCSNTSMIEDFLKFAPCIWTWTNGGRCMDSYDKLLNHVILDKPHNGSQQLEQKKYVKCCSYRHFLRCVSLHTSTDCGLAEASYFRRFILKLANHSSETLCSSFQGVGSCDKYHYRSSSQLDFYSHFAALLPICMLLLPHIL